MRLPTSPIEALLWLIVIVAAIVILFKLIAALG